MSNRKILVAGGSGRLGQMVLEQLLRVGTVGVVATTRTPEKLALFAERGVEVRAADFNDPATLREAFHGVERLLLISTDDLFSGKRVQQHKNAIDAAKAAGVRHILYTSMPDPEGSTAIPFSNDHIETEAAIRASGLTYSLLRVAWYSENPIELGLIPAALRTGNWYSSAGEGKIAYVPRLEVARAAAAALAATGDESRVLDITGPAALSASELAATLARVTGKPIALREVDGELQMHSLVEAGVSAQLAPMLVATDANTLAGHFSLASTAVEDLTGSAPISFEDFLLNVKDELLRAA